MLLEDRSVLLLAISTIALLIALTSSVTMVVLAAWRRGRRERKTHVRPYWSDALPGVLAGGLDRVLWGAVPPNRSSLHGLRRWAELNGSSVKVLDDEGLAETHVARASEEFWAIYLPSFRYLAEASRASSKPQMDQVLDALAADAEQWLSLLTSSGARQIGVLGYYDPLSAAELSAPPEQARMATVVSRLNDTLRDCARRFNADWLDTRSLFESRSGEFTRAPQGHYYLNNLGHAVQTGLIKEWLLGDGSRSETSLVAEDLFRIATGVG